MARAAASASWTVASALQHWRKEHRDTGRSRHKFAQEFQPLCQLDREKIDPLRLGTRPSLTGSSPTTKAMGMVVVAALAVSAEAVPPVATMSATCLRTSSPPRAGIWSSRFSAPTVVDRDVLAFGIASVFQACRNPRRDSANTPGDWGWRNPTTGIAVCCARAASGQEIWGFPHRASGPRTAILERENSFREVPALRVWPLLFEPSRLA